MTVRAKGTYQVKQQRPRRIKRAESEGYSVPFVGPYSALASAEPAIDATLAGFPGDYKVREVNLEHTGGDSGRMLVTIERPLPGSTGSQSDAQIGVPVYELIWSEERRPLQENRRCGRLKAERPYYEYPDRRKSAANPSKTATEAAEDSDKVYRQRSWENWESLDDDDYDPPTVGGGWNLTNFRRLKEAGYNDFPVAYPLARVTIYAKYRIAAPGGTYQVSTPPAQCGAPGGWYYVKTASESKKEGRLYTLVEEWRGYNRVDDLFFL